MFSEHKWKNKPSQQILDWMPNKHITGTKKIFRWKVDGPTSLTIAWKIGIIDVERPDAHTSHLSYKNNVRDSGRKNHYVEDILSHQKRYDSRSYFQVREC